MHASVGHMGGSTMMRGLLGVVLAFVAAGASVVAADPARLLSENAGNLRVLREGPMQALRVLSAVGEIPSNLLSTGLIGQANYETHGNFFPLLRELHDHDLYNETNPDPNASFESGGAIGGNSGAAAAQAQEQAKLFPRLNPLNNFEPYDMDKYGVILVEVCGTKVGDKNTDASTGLATSDCVANVNTQMAYLASLAFTGVPGFVIGIICLVFAILFCLCRCICCICCGTNFCPTGSSETGYSPMAKLIPKVCILGFSGIALVGCGLGYYGNASLTDSLNGLVSTLIGEVDKMVAVVVRVDSAISSAGDALGQDVSLGDLVTAANDISDALGESTGSLSGTFNQVQLVGLGIGSFYAVMLAFGMIGTFLNVNLFLYITVLFGVIVLFTSWIMFGLFFFTANLTSDICFVIGEYLVDPSTSTLGSFFPCLPADTARESIGTTRSVYSDVLDAVNLILGDINDGIATQQALYDLQQQLSPVPPNAIPEPMDPLPFMCDIYERLPVSDACNSTLVDELIDSVDGKLYYYEGAIEASDSAAGRDSRCDESEFLTGSERNPDYVRCVPLPITYYCGADCSFYFIQTCAAYGDGDVDGTEDFFRFRPSPWNDDDYTMDAPACPYVVGNQTYSVDARRFESTYSSIRCAQAASANVETCINDGTPIPGDDFDQMVTLINAAVGIGALVPDMEWLVSCQFVYDAFEALNGALCEAMLSSASLLWTAFLLVGVCFIPLTFLWLYIISMNMVPYERTDENFDEEGDPYTEENPKEVEEVEEGTA